MASARRIKGSDRIGDDGARALSALTGLTSLHLGGNCIGDITPLVALDYLEKLTLSYNQIRDACTELWLKPPFAKLISPMRPWGCHVTELQARLLTRCNFVGQ